MNAHQAELSWIDSQAAEMLRLVSEWSGINSGSRNLQGLAHSTDVVQKGFESLGGHIERRDLPPVESVDGGGHVVKSAVGQALRIVKRADAPLRIMLCIHLDTVYGADHPFQKPMRIDASTLRGPGVADAKGGLVILLAALRALDRSDSASKVGWEVVLNPDEEIASPGSSQLLLEVARMRNHALACCLSRRCRMDRWLGRERVPAILRWSCAGVYAAHSGRDFHLGRTVAAILGAGTFHHTHGRRVRRSAGR